MAPLELMTFPPQLLKVLWQPPVLLEMPMENLQQTVPLVM
jgi:hypothetical protein